jgi:hypothetical protein
MGSVGNWKDLAAICVKIRDESTPQQWLLPAKALPQESQHNVLGAPAESGILDAEELEMTEQDVSSLLEAYRTGRWTVRRVVTAFLKRATVMQQLVRHKAAAPSRVKNPANARRRLISLRSSSLRMRLQERMNWTSTSSLQGN